MLKKSQPDCLKVVLVLIILDPIFTAAKLGNYHGISLLWKKNMKKNKSLVVHFWLGHPSKSRPIMSAWAPCGRNAPFRSTYKGHLRIPGALRVLEQGNECTVVCSSITWYSKITRKTTELDFVFDAACGIWESWITGPCHLWTESNVVTWLQAITYKFPSNSDIHPVAVPLVTPEYLNNPTYFGMFDSSHYISIIFGCISF